MSSQAQAASAAKITETQAPLRLLVVEDDLPSLEMMYEVLTSLGADVQPASESERVTEVIVHERFDGIFVDLQMPNLDGFVLTQLIRKSSKNRTTPIVVITALDDRDTMQKIFALGATFFLRKPVDRQKIRALLNSARGVMLKNRPRSSVA